MAVRRTKKTRIKAASKRRQTPAKKRSSVKQKNKVADKSSELINYDIKLITKDLTRTLISTLVVFGILVALYYQL